ncbi:cupin domain-containing protein [Gracilibacillus alcaliphilus]|uniref:cupin domain-containing protein n=1 Tax=Gracilibacillus alcaliphilus TaxID=1401441 RepID=UPI00195ABF51|nr:cupin domain-containing protein [Gracilibacillus alcaliphilus]MBM7676152.1 uncharacterized protein YjlB [Gracilibacillus alcaliphilus]
MKKPEDITIESLKFGDNGSIPNHPTYSLLLYKNVMTFDDNPKDVLTKNKWLDAWRGSVAPYHHYHSNSHEALIVADGAAILQVGGEQGQQVHVEQGDAIILPAGFGHKLIESNADFAVIGAYPNGQSYDFCYGKADERPEKLANIKKVPLPEADPVFGKVGPLFSYWAE